MARDVIEDASGAFGGRDVLVARKPVRAFDEMTRHESPFVEMVGKVRARPVQIRVRCSVGYQLQQTAVHVFRDQSRQNKCGSTDAMMRDTASRPSLRRKNLSFDERHASYPFMEVVPFILDGERLMNMYLPDVTTDFPGANVQESIKRHGVWAPAECRILRDHVRSTKKRGLMVDVGANTGVFGLLALRLGWDVVFVDANDVHRKYIEASIRDVPSTAATHRFVTAFVGETDGESVPFDGWSGNQSLMTGPSTLVHQVTLDALIPDGCDFLKIDVEGAEDRVLAGATRLLDKGKLPVIMFEVTYFIDGRMCAAQTDVLRMLKRRGYDLFEIFDEHRSPIADVDAQIERWHRDLVTCHIPAQPGLTVAGTNVLAVLNRPDHASSSDA